MTLASTLGETDVVSSLLELGADVHQKDSFGMTAQQWAEMKGHHNIVDLLKYHAIRTGKHTNI